ncbi:hypothetical protein V8E36_009333 [Tilletia maclaganii]
MNGNTRVTRLGAARSAAATAGPSTGAAAGAAGTAAAGPSFVAYTAPAPPSLRAASIASRSIREQSVMSTAARSRPGETSARKRKRIFSGDSWRKATRSVSGASPSVSPRLGQGMPSGRSPAIGGGQRLRPSLEHGPDGDLNGRLIKDRCNVLEVQSKAVLDFYARFQDDGWTDETITRMNAIWVPFEGYKTHSLLANKDYAHHFVNVPEILAQLDIHPDRVSQVFSEAMELVNLATFIHYIFQLPSDPKQLGELEDGRVTEDIALTAPIRALTELNDARRVFLKWIVPTDWDISDEVLCMLLDLSTHIHIQRVRNYMQQFAAGRMTELDLGNKVEESLDELMSSEVLENALLKTFEERELDDDEFALIVQVYAGFSAVRTQELAAQRFDWVKMLRTWPLLNLTDDFLQLADKIVKDPTLMLQSHTLGTIRHKIRVMNYPVPHRGPPSGAAADLDRSGQNGVHFADGDNTVIVHEPPGESTPRPRSQLHLPRNYDPRQSSSNEEYPSGVGELLETGLGEEDEDLLAPLPPAEPDDVLGDLFNADDADGDLLDEEAPPSKRQRKGAASSAGGRSKFSNLNMAGESQARTGEQLLSRRPDQGLTDSEADDLELVVEEEEEAAAARGDAYERSQARATRNAARGRASIGAEAARGETGNRPLSSHVREGAFQRGERLPSPLGNRGRTRIGFGKNSVLATLDGPKRSILADKSKGERITFDENDDDVFLEQQGSGRPSSSTTQSRGKKTAASASTGPGRQSRATANGSSGNASVEDTTEGRSTRAKGKQRLVDDGPLQPGPEESQQAQTQSQQAPFDAQLDDFGPPDLGGDTDDDEGAAAFAAAMEQSAREAGDQDGGGDGQADDAEAQSGSGAAPAEGGGRTEAGTSRADDSDADEGGENAAPPHSSKRRAGTRNFPGATQTFKASSQAEQIAQGSRSAVLSQAGRKAPRPGDERVSSPASEDEDEEDVAGGRAKKPMTRAKAAKKTKAKAGAKASVAREEEDEDEEEADEELPRRIKAKSKKKPVEVDEGEEEEEEEQDELEDSSVASSSRKKKKKALSKQKRLEARDKYKPKSYKVATGARRFWTEAETDCLMAALHKYTFLRVLGKRPKGQHKGVYPVYDLIIKKHGPRGTKSHDLARRTNVQLKDKARSELERMRREHQTLPYWKKILFPSLFKDMKRKDKVEKIPAEMDISEDEGQFDSSGDDRRAEYEGTDEESDDDGRNADRSATPPAQPPRKSKSSATPGPRNGRATRSKGKLPASAPSDNESNGAGDGDGQHDEDDEAILPSSPIPTPPRKQPNTIAGNRRSKRGRPAGSGASSSNQTATAAAADAGIDAVSSDSEDERAVDGADALQQTPNGSSSKTAAAASSASQGGAEGGEETRGEAHGTGSGSGARWTEGAEVGGEDGGWMTLRPLRTLRSGRRAA